MQREAAPPAPGLLRACALWALLCAAALPLAAQQPDRRILLEQKARLIEALLGSPRARDAGAALQEIYAQARERLQVARAATVTESYDAAGHALDEALRLLSAASARGAAPLAESARRAENASLHEQVQLYRAALAATLSGRAAGDGAQELDRVDTLLAAAAQSSAAQRHDAANRQLAEAYVAVAAALARLRAGETVVTALAFDAPVDEYAYELRRHDGHRMLVDLTLARSAADAQLRARAQAEVAASRGLRERAELLAAQDDHAAAVRTMEESISHLVRALRALGVPVF